MISSVASDAGYIVLIPLGAAAFLSVGRHPIAGIAAAFAGVAAGFGVNFLITPLDGVLTEITNDASALVDPNAEIDLAANLFFGIASALFVTRAADVRDGALRREPDGHVRPVGGGRGARGRAGGRSTPEAEARGLRYALWATLGVVVVIALLTAIPGAPLQDPETGRVIGDSPFMDSLIVIIALIFFAAGLAYGHGAGTMKGSAAVLASITKSWAGLASLLFLFLLIAQFIAYFNFSNMAQVAAVQLGDLLERADIGAVWLLIGFIIVTMVVDLIMPAAIAKWAILAPIFIPLLIRLNVTPQTVLAAYRVGDSPLNVVTPLMAYFPLIVVFVKRYQKHAGIGTVVSLMLPYVIILSVGWTLFFVAWYLLGIPWGPGSPVHPVAARRRWTTAPSRSSSSARSSRCSSGTACRSRSSRSASRSRCGRPACSSLDDALAGLRRSDGALHRLAVRRQRGAGRLGRDGVGGAGAGRARGGRAGRS